MKIDNKEAQVEVCEFCGKKLIYNKEKTTGRVDNSQYLRDHIRDTVQPYGATHGLYMEIYGREQLQKLKEFYKRKEKCATQEDIRNEARDTMKTLLKLESKGYPT